MSAPLVLLGPQRLRPTLKDAIACLGVTGRVATVTAGWEEREGEDAELDEHLAGRTVNLGLFPRAEERLELRGTRRRILGSRHGDKAYAQWRRT